MRFTTTAIRNNGHNVRVTVSNVDGDIAANPEGDETPWAIAFEIPVGDGELESLVKDGDEYWTEFPDPHNKITFVEVYVKFEGHHVPVKKEPKIIEPIVGGTG